MRIQLISLWNKIRESYWFIPSLMAIGAFFLSFITTSMDQTLDPEWVRGISWLYTNQADGARAVLSTVAGSMITVAGVTFSMTILSISYATSQVGPRLLRHFMRDKGNQITLGVFISTFLYCLMVLRTVRASSPDSVASELMSSAFVPHFSVLTGVLLAVLSVGVLIYFIHHIPESIHISNIISNLGKELNTGVDKLFPSKIGQPNEDASERQTFVEINDAFLNNASFIVSHSSGYIQFVDADRLLEVASKNKVILRLRFRAGDFVTTGDTLLLLTPRQSLTKDLEKEFGAAFVVGTQRTEAQDLRFVINELIEVAMRALSPGVNDPFTAMDCLDWLQSALENLSGRRMPDANRYDEEKELRLIAEPESFEAFASQVFDQLRPYFAQDRNAAVHMMEVLAKMSLKDLSRSQQRILVLHGIALKRHVAQSVNLKRDLKVIDARLNSLIKISRRTTSREKLIETTKWLGGRA